MSDKAVEALALNVLKRLMDTGTLVLNVLAIKVGVLDDKLLASATILVESVCDGEVALVHAALSAANVPPLRQFEISSNLVHRAAVELIGYLKKIGSGEPINDAHARFLGKGAKADPVAAASAALREAIASAGTGKHLA